MAESVVDEDEAFIASMDGVHRQLTVMSLAFPNGEKAAAIAALLEATIKLAAAATRSSRAGARSCSSPNKA